MEYGHAEESECVKGFTGTVTCVHMLHDMLVAPCCQLAVDATLDGAGMLGS